MSGSPYRLPSEERWLNCTRCDLCKKRKRVVIGFGNPKSKLMLIGEGPGANEDEQGVPYVGDAGQMLNLFLKFVSVHRPDDIFLDNIVACRPPNNRKPTPEEVAACMPRLYQAIYEIDPILIIATGATALKALTGDATKVGAARGDMFYAKVPGWYQDVIYPVIAMYHPSFLLRNRHDKKPGSPMDLTGDDFELAMKLYDQYRNIVFGHSIPNR